ncbi:MAG: hypothetical protein R3C03_17465 [Pirellulaceae bacterium]
MRPSISVAMPCLFAMPRKLQLYVGFLVFSLCCCVSAFSHAQAVDNFPFNATPAISTYQVGSVLVATNSEHLRWQAILSQEHPNINCSETEASIAFCKLAELGLPIVIDDSAEEDEMGSDTFIEISAISAPLLDRLLFALEQQNATIQFDDHFIRVISRDVAVDPEYLIHRQYDVTALVGTNAGYPEVEPLIDLIVSDITPDDWTFTQGDQTVKPLLVGGRTVLAIAATYKAHCQLERFFAQTYAIAGIQPLPLRRYPSPSGIASSVNNLSTGGMGVPVAYSGGSTAVTLPERDRKAGINVITDFRSTGNGNSGGFGGFGGGGFGGGGGVFSLPNR